MRKLITALLATFAIVACDSTTAPDLTPFAGNYGLRSVNDTLLPYTVYQHIDTTIAIAADTFFLGVNGVFLNATRYRRTTTAGVDFLADSIGGTWTVRGSDLEIIATNGSGLTATIGPTSFTTVGGGNKAVYSK